jgi:hypothetical protein
MKQDASFYIYIKATILVIQHPVQHPISRRDLISRPITPQAETIPPDHTARVKLGRLSSQFCKLKIISTNFCEQVPEEGDQAHVEEEDQVEEQGQALPQGQCHDQQPVSVTIAQFFKHKLM